MSTSRPTPSTTPRTSARPFPSRDWATLVRVLQSSLINHVSQRLEDLELPNLQWILLLRLWRLGSTTQADLARDMRADAATLMRAVDRVAERGWLVRERSTTDRRLVFLTLTETGDEVVARIWSEVVWVQKRYMEGFSETERQQLLGLLERMAVNANAVDQAG